MANNRMVIACNVCIPKDEDWKDIKQEGILHISKWYPGGNGAYFRNSTDSMGEEFEEFLLKHAHTEIPSQHYSVGAGQPNPIRILYESIDLPAPPRDN